MKKTKGLRKIFATFLASVAMVGGGVALLDNRVQGTADEQADVTIEQNYNIQSANGGKYADYLITESAQYYSGGEINYNSGRLYEATTKGYATTVRLLEEYSGTFSIIGQGFMENLYKAENDKTMTGSDGYAVDYQRLAFTFTNLENENQYVKLSFFQSDSNYLCLNVYYYDEAIAGTTALYRQDNILNIASSFTGKSFISYTDSAGTNRPLRFSYDLTSQNLNAYAFRNSDGVAVHNHNLNDLFQTASNNPSNTPMPTNASLPTFARYSVDMTFDMKSQKTNTAKFIAYELCGQTLAGQTPTNTAGASIFVKPTDKVVANFAYNIPTASAYDVLDGDISSQVVCQALYNGVEPVNMIDGAFFVEKTTGFYTLSYSVQDTGGMNSNTEIQVDIHSSIPATEVVFAGELLESYPIGSVIQIPSANAYSGIKYQKTITPYYTLIQKDGVVLRRMDDNTDRAYTVNQVGNYDVVYVFINELGVITTQTKSFEVKDLPRFENTNLPQTLSLNWRYELPVATLVQGDTAQAVTISIVAPDGSSVPVQENVFTPTQVGEYIVRFSAQFNGVEYVQENSAYCAIGAQTLIQNVAGVVSVQGNVDLPSYSLSGNGIEILADARNSSFRFNNPIDLNKLDKDEDLIELQVLSGDKYANYTELIIELIDVENEQNVVKVKYRYNQWNDTYSYVLLNYNGKSLGIRNEAGHVGEVDNYFGMVTHNSFSGYKYKSKTPFSVRVDYAEKQFFVREINNTYKMLLDTDDADLVGENIWSGFTSGKVYVQVTMQTLYDVGGVIVTKLAGQSLSGALLEDEVAPNPYLEENAHIRDYTQMPTGCLGYAYTLPTVVGQDVLSPYCTVERVLYLKNGSELVPIEIGNANEFTPTTAGEYQLWYTVSDLYGNYEEIELNFTVLTQRNVAVAFGSQPSQAVVGERFRIPEIEVLGASGEIIFEYAVFLNEREVGLSRNREIYLDSVGEIKIVYSFSDYLEKGISGQLSIPVLASDYPIIEIDGCVPLTALKGRTLTLPQSSAKVFLSNETVSANCWIEVDGVRISGYSFEITKNKNEKIIVQYFAEYDGCVSERVYTLTVLEPTHLSDYLIVDDYTGVRFGNEKFYTSIITNKDNTISLPNVVVCDDMTLRFTINPSYNQFTSLQIKLMDSVARERVMTITIEPNGQEKSKVTFGNRTVDVSASFYNRDNEFYFIIDSKSKTISDVNGTVLFTLEEFENGDSFDGFTNGVAYLSFAINGVQVGGENAGSLELIQVSNQIFASTYKSGVLQPYTDKTAPVLFLKEKLYNHTVEYNSELVIPSAWAYDVLGGAKDVKVSLIAPSGRSVIENANCNEDVTVALTEYGYYTIRYTTENNGKPYHVEYYVKVRNRNLPQISIDGTVKDTYALGEKLTIPKASVLNNQTDSVTLYVFLQMPSARIVNYTGKTEIGFVDKGEYALIFYAVDEEYNVTEKIYTFKVV